MNQQHIKQGEMMGADDAISINYVLAVITALTTVIGVLWAVVVMYSNRERTRNDKNEEELKELRRDYVTTLTEVAELKGTVQGTESMSKKVLERIEDLHRRSERNI